MGIHMFCSYSSDYVLKWVNSVIPFLLGLYLQVTGAVFFLEGENDLLYLADFTQSIVFKLTH